jgi:GxxExxY protein
MPTQGGNKLLYEDETYKIRNACFEIWKMFGGAFKEKIVERALVKALIKRDLRVEAQKKINIYYDGEVVGIYIPDIIINGLVLLEIKCKPFITPEDERQFWLYLKGSNYKLGLLINFGTKTLEIRRRIFDQARRIAPHKSA